MSCRSVRHPRPPRKDGLLARFDAALPFALRFGRTLGVSLGIALIIAVAYYLLFSVGLTVASALPALPEVGVWLANIVFGVAGLWLLRRA